MNFTDITKSKYFTRGLIVLGGLIVLALTFNLGVFVGYSKANFSQRWGDNYRRNFGGPTDGFGLNSRMMSGRRFDRRPGMMPLPAGPDFVNAHGTTGVVVQVSPVATGTPLTTSTIIIKGNDGVEKTVVMNAKTTILKDRQNVPVNNVAVDDMVVVIGQPNNIGQIEAKLIRIFSKQ
ncbi:MAG: hypothetical protein WCK11_00715 [Candidatus Falkowbacteria bacterium]